MITEFIDRASVFPLPEATMTVQQVVIQVKSCSTFLKWIISSFDEPGATDNVESQRVERRCTVSSIQKSQSVVKDRNEQREEHDLVWSVFTT